MMKNHFKIMALLIIVKLFSGGVCVGTWETDKTAVIAYSAVIKFKDNKTGNKITLAGTWCAEKIKGER